MTTTADPGHRTATREELADHDRRVLGARQNRRGDPCPPWCTEDHAHSSDLHRTERTAVYVDGIDGYVATLGGIFGAGPEVAVHAAWYDPANGCTLATEGNLYMAAADAAQLGAVIEILARATPDQHRQLAAAIRKAAAQIADPDAWAFE